MKRVALATYAELPSLGPSERLAAAALARLGVEAAPAVWNDPAVDWAGFDGVVVRSIWDYHYHFEQFLAWLAALERAGVRVWNRPGLMRWNANKLYLRELEARGAAIVPTVFVERGDRRELRDILEERGWDEAVVKPVVSAGARETVRVSRANAAEGQALLERLAEREGAMVQPFLQEVRTGGEWSLLFFEGEYSHAVCKRPAAGDFRVQAQHGGRIVPAEPPEGIIARAQRVMELIGEPTLYARVDGVEVGDAFLLMELELIEPELFLAENEPAAERFAGAVARSIEG